LDLAIADAFREQFGGERVNKPQSRAKDTN
jgi:hypothetical protein